MSLRDDTMHMFGPILLEAFALMVLDEVNIIRQQLGLPLRTKQQLLQTINNHTTTLQPYDWMKEYL